MRKRRRIGQRRNVFTDFIRYRHVNFELMAHCDNAPFFGVPA